MDPLKETATGNKEKAVRAISIDKVNNFEVIGNDKLIEMFADEVTRRKNQFKIDFTPVIAPVIRSPSVLSIMKALDRGTGPLKIYDTDWGGTKTRSRSRSRSRSNSLKPGVGVDRSSSHLVKKYI